MRTYTEKRSTMKTKDENVLSDTISIIHSMCELPKEYVDYRKAVENNLVSLIMKLDECLRSMLGDKLESVIRNEDKMIEETCLIQYYYIDEYNHKNVISIGTDARMELGDVADEDPDVYVNICIGKFQKDLYDEYIAHPMIGGTFCIRDNKIYRCEWGNISDSYNDNLSDEEVFQKYEKIINAIDCIDLEVTK